MSDLEFALDTFGDVTRDAGGALLPHDQVIRNLIAEAVLADEVGVDYFGLGEHHRDDFAVSAPEIVLAAIAGQTKRIRLGTAVTVLSTDDPVRVYERFATLDALSGGRAEVILGRGSFTESYPLFGYDLRDYEQLFEEKLDLFWHLTNQQPVTWSGKTRASLTKTQVYPPLGPNGLKTWIGVGGSPESVVRAVRYDLPMMLAIIGGNPRRFRPFVQLYRDAYDQIGKAPKGLGVHSPGLIAATDAEAQDIAFEGYRALRDRIGRERGWPPTSADEFRQEVEVGSMYVGAPLTVARKIASTIKALGLQRFEMKYSMGTASHEALMTSIGLYGREVVPLVRELLAKSS